MIPLKRATPRIARTTSPDEWRVNSAVWMTTTAAYASPKARPLSSNAPGMDRARTRNAPMPASSSSRRLARSGATTFVSQA